MFGNKKTTHDSQPDQAVIGTIPKRRRLTEGVTAFTGAIGRTVKRHVLVAAVLGLLLIGSGVFLALRQREPSETAPLTGLSYDASYRKQQMESGQAGDYGDFLILGKQAIEQKDYKAAEEYFKKAEAQKGNELDVLYALATVYRLLENKSRSLEYYEKVIALAEPENSANHVNLNIYKSEKQAIEAGDFMLRNVLSEGFNAL